MQKNLVSIHTVKPVNVLRVRRMGGLMSLYVDVLGVDELVVVLVAVLIRFKI